MSARDELFDLAVTRSLAYATKLGGLSANPPGPGEEQGDRAASLSRLLEVWYLKTRFAYRVPLDEVVDVLLTWPGPGHYWQGGPQGGWQVGTNPRP